MSFRAHTEDYVATLAELGEAVGDTPIAFTPFVQTKRGVPPRKIKPIANSDTFWSSGTLRAASRAAGAAVEAVKRVVEGRNRHVFCCVRPPGHHAGLEGATENAVSSGIQHRKQRHDWYVCSCLLSLFSFLLFVLRPFSALIESAATVLLCFDEVTRVVVTDTRATHQILFKKRSCYTETSEASPLFRQIRIAHLLCRMFICSSRCCVFW